MNGGCVFVILIIEISFTFLRKVRPPRTDFYETHERSKRLHADIFYRVLPQS